MEELVGRLWHQFITRAASVEHDTARVHLAEMQRAIELLFRAAGGGATVRVRQATEQQRGGARNWLQKIAGSATQEALPGLDADSLSLPPSIAVFSQRSLNRDLYLWLATLAACYVDTGQWVSDNQWATQCVLHMFPGMRIRRHRLLQAHLQQRPLESQLKDPSALAERFVSQALQLDPMASVVPLPWSGKPLTAADVAPVWLWLSPQDKPANMAQPSRPTSDAEPDHRQGATLQDKKRRKAHHTDNATDRNGMMMFFRAESIMSWSEYVKVNRQTDDDDDGNAIKAADDMNSLAITADGQTSAARVKFDLDLPAAAQDDLPLGPGVVLPEWNWKQQRLVPDHCSAQLLEARQPAPYQAPAHLQLTARRVRRKL
ncbi:MAG: VWA domain-containing protein, partial [Aquabacterium sp.]|nr:VWA domain-containing protein [Aquabacterium sp.]